MFTQLRNMAIHIGVLESCMPMNHPLMAYMPSVAGAAQMRTKK